MKAQNISNSNISITLPDGAVRQYDAGITGAEIAADISKSLAKTVIAIKIDGELSDLSLPIEADASIALIKRDDDEALEMIRHDAAHVMAEAVQTLFPGTQVTIGPAIDNGFYYDFARDEPFSTEDFEKIEKEMRKIVERNSAFVREVWKRDDAIAYFKGKGENYKAELIEDLPEEEEIKIYRQGEGDDGWLDLCRGPHMPTTKHVGTAFKLMKVAGAYWRGDSNNAMLQRIYGTAWRNDKELKAHLTMLEEAEARDHRKLGNAMDLFHFQDEAPGQVFWHHNGWVIYTALMDYMRRKVRAAGYQEINTPQLLDARFWKASGHWDKYRENMFIFGEEGEENPSALKPMSCPGGAQVYKAGLRSYRELPLRLAEFGHVFRQEPSGARHGLMRVQAFTQDDAHIFCTHDQLEDEVVKMCDLIKEVYTDLGIADDITINFSTRPEQRIGSEEDWDRAEAGLRKVLDRIDMKWVLNEGDGAFYAPKLDFILRDAIGREWQCGTVQVDMNMPTRLDLQYVGEDGERHAPHMVHRAILGSVERFLGVLIEHYAGKLPLWLAPVQCVVTPITSDFDGYAQDVLEQLQAAGIRAEIDLRNEKINYKVREHSLAKVSALFVVGAREQENKTVAIRRLGSKDQNVVALHEAINALADEAKAPY
ncbi:MAG: threonine--tRNA ligase [Alphaproteobacteria bacterium]|nr:threonine--tRNA ligase [Alphaproteobacteria bacterium]